MSDTATRRVQMDIKNFNGTTHEGMYYYPDEENILVGYGMICGPGDSPYEDGFYLIKFQFPGTYPFAPPKCTHLSFCDRRQSPNFHDAGTVCLSRLNTWGTGDPWLPTMNIYSVLSMIRAQVMTPSALDNEPMYNHSAISPENAKAYDEVVRHCNYKYNVVKIYRATSAASGSAIPVAVSTLMATDMLAYFQEHAEKYRSDLLKLAAQHDGKRYNCTTYTNAGCYCEYSGILKEFNEILGTPVARKIQLKLKAEG